MIKKIKNSRRRFTTLKLLLLLGCVFPPYSAFQVGAIIIRHDKGYGDYLIRESRFPAVFYLEQQADRKVCVATLIDPRWAITAAHCADETGLSHAMASGKKFSVTIANRPQQIEKTVVHPDYLPTAIAEVDLALLYFADDVEFPLPLSVNDRDDELHSVITILGWGFFGLGTTGRQYSDGAFRMAQNRIEESAHRLHIRFDDPREASTRVLDLEGTPGLGDSGGPALLQSEKGWIIVGIAVGELEDEQFSEESQGSYGSVAVYERLSSHLGWIRSTIEDGQLVASE